MRTVPQTTRHVLGVVHSRNFFAVQRFPESGFADSENIDSAATVGIIALAAMQLSQKAITDKLTRILVFLGGSAGMLYNALWYFPVLMVLGGAATILWDYRLGHNAVRAAKAGISGLGDRPSNHSQEERGCDQAELQDVPRRHSSAASAPSSVHHVSGTTQPLETSSHTARDQLVDEDRERVVPANLEFRLFSWKLGATILGGFLITFVVVMILRGILRTPPLAFRVFANLYLAGTIIFGGGPVVIPLLREYVVAQGWVSPRDFLLGLAITQAFPGPNFNFAVYLAALAVGSEPNPAAGAVIGYIAIFAPGIILHTGTMGLWKMLRNRRWFTSCLRGVNAAAVGLIYTAVYRLWEQGFLGEAFSSGSSLGREPWWLVVTATSFVGGQWFHLSPPIAIILGGLMGMIWYGVVTV